MQRVDVGEEVAAGAVGLDQLHDAGVFINTGVGQILGPAHGGVRHAHDVENVVPEVIIDQQAAHGAEEFTGLCTLDDAVIVGRGDGDELADTELCEAILGSTLELSGVVHGADTDDGALALSQARHRVASADAAGVSERNGDSGEVFTGELACAATVDDVFVGFDELGEGKGLTFADCCDNQCTGAVLLRQVDSQTEVDVFRYYQEGLAIAQLVGVVHVRVGHDCLHHGVADDVGEGNLATAGAAQVIIDDRAVFEHQARRHVAH